jgi:putative ABC transport system permease protein
MKVPDLLDLAGRNLRESVLRNSLTTMGISVGVASLVAMLSLGVGLQQLFTRQLARTGLFDSIFVSQGFGPRAPRREVQQSPPRRLLDNAVRSDLEHISGVKEVYPDVRFMAQVKRAEEPWKPQWQELPKYEMVAALPLSARERDAFEGMKGSFFSSADAEETILQMESAKLFDAKNPTGLIGQEITIRFPQRKALPAEENSSTSTSGAESKTAKGENQNIPAEARAALEQMGAGYSVVVHEQKLKVVGIVEPRADNIFRGAQNGGIYIPVGFAEELQPMQMGDQRATVAGPMTGQKYSGLVVRVNKAAEVERIEGEIKKMGVNAFSLLDAATTLRRVFAFVDLFLGVFGSLALAVASLGIVNTLVMSILERRREIGIMKAIGASDKDVRSLFFFEAGAMGLLGGGLGVLFGWIIGRVINFGTQIYMQRQQQDFTAPNVWSVPWWLIGGAIGFSIIVSLISGLYPATRAAKLDPVQALRYE